MIQVSHIRKSYGNKIILRDTSFRIACKELVAVVGRNGCGKSTLMQIMAGVLPADDGEITYFSHKAFDHSNVFRKFCGYVPQENPLMEELSVLDNLRLWSGKKHPNLQMIIEQFQLEELLKVKVNKLSGGMKRRLSIACALIEWPPILLLDEPTSALDLYHKESIHQWLLDYRSRNGIVLMTTHDESEILQADRCLIMEQGIVTEIEPVNYRKCIS